MKLAANTRVNMRVEQKPSGILPMNHSNKDGKPSAESEEGRLLIKENTLSSSTHPTQSGSACSTGESVRTRFMLGRYSSAIRAACAKERSCGSARGGGRSAMFVPTATANKRKFTGQRRRELGSLGVSILLCKRPGFVFGDGCAREGAASLPSPSDVERFCALMTQLSPGPAFVPATES
jgi:hypothetical protein